MFFNQSAKNIEQKILEKLDRKKLFRLENKIVKYKSDRSINVIAPKF